MRWALSLLGVTLEVVLTRNGSAEECEEEPLDEPVSVSGYWMDAGYPDESLGFRTPACEPMEWE